MDAIATQEYVKVQREISSIDQVRKEQKRIIYLYKDRVVTEYREFPVEQVHDMSFRMFGKDNGLLYIHTSKGVYTYNVKTSPQGFIEAFKQLLSKLEKKE